MARKRKSRKNKNLFVTFGILALVIAVIGVGIYFGIVKNAYGDLTTSCYVTAAANTSNVFSCQAGQCNVLGTAQCSGKSSSVSKAAADYSVPYSCPAGSNVKCNVKGTMECNNPTGAVDTVVFRTNANSLDDYNTRDSVKWISLNGVINGATFTKTADLHPYCVTTSTGGSVGTLISPPAGKSWVYGTELRAYNGWLVVKTGTPTNPVYRSYSSSCGLSSSDLADATQLTPNSAYAGKEVTGGTSNPYSCSGAFTIQKSVSDATIIYTEPLKYVSATVGGTTVSSQQTITAGNVVYVIGGSKNTVNAEVVDLTQAYSCSTPAYITTNGVQTKVEDASYQGSIQSPYSTKPYQLLAGQAFNFQGIIAYQVIDPTLACSVSTCTADKTGYIGCYKPSNSQCLQKAQTITSCGSGQYCVDSASGATCKTPFDITGSFVDANGHAKTGYGIGEPIYFKYSIQSSSVSSATAVFTFTDLNDIPVSSVVPISKTFTFPQSNPTITMPIAPQTITGSYKMKVRLSFNQQSADDGPYTTSVANTITTDISGTSADSVGTIYSNTPAIVRIKVFDTGGVATAATTNIVSAQLIEGGGKVTSLTYTSTDFQNGVYDYIYTIPTISVDSILRIQATATKLGYTATLNKDIIIKPAVLNVEMTNIAKLQDIGVGVPITIDISTTNSQGNKVDVDSIKAYIELPSGRTDPAGGFSDPAVFIPTKVSGETGHYQLAYTFKEKDTHFVWVSAQKTGHITSPIESPAINVQPGLGTGLQCISNAECGVGRICTANVCVSDTTNPPTANYLVIFLIGGVIIAIVILVVVLLRRKKTQVSSSYIGNY